MSTERITRFNRAEVNFSKIFKNDGQFKNVYEGAYIEGHMRGERCVTKEFKERAAFEDSYYQEELDIIRDTQEFLDRFNSANIVDLPVTLINPDILESQATKKRYLVEPMIKIFEHFNSNTGCAPEKGPKWIDAMQALSHYSYHISNGLCFYAIFKEALIKNDCKLIELFAII
jgi:hypothetical protein